MIVSFADHETEDIFLGTNASWKRKTLLLALIAMTMRKSLVGTALALALRKNLGGVVMSMATRKRLPRSMLLLAARKLDILNAAKALKDLQGVPTNDLVKLQGNEKGHYRIRIDERFHIHFVWTKAGPEDVMIVDYK